MTTLHDLPAKWRELAKGNNARGFFSVGQAQDQCASDLERALSESPLAAEAGAMDDRVPIALVKVRHALRELRLLGADADRLDTADEALEYASKVMDPSDCRYVRPAPSPVAAGGVDDAKREVSRALDAEIVAQRQAATEPVSEREVRKAEHLIADAGIFKGHEGLRDLAKADAFWRTQPYGTRLYFGDGITQYLHRSVLEAAIAALDTAAGRSPLSPSAGAVAWCALGPDGELVGLTATKGVCGNNTPLYPHPLEVSEAMVDAACQAYAMHEDVPHDAYGASEVYERAMRAALNAALGKGE